MLWLHGYYEFKKNCSVGWQQQNYIYYSIIYGKKIVENAFDAANTIYKRMEIVKISFTAATIFTWYKNAVMFILVNTWSEFFFSSCLWAQCNCNYN